MVLWTGVCPFLGSRLQFAVIDHLEHVRGRWLCRLIDLVDAQSYLRPQVIVNLDDAISLVVAPGAIAAHGS